MSDLFDREDGAGVRQPETLKVLTKSEVMGRQFQIYGTVENPLFRAKDVAEWLEIQNVSQLVKDLDESEKGIFSIYTPGGVQNVNMLTEDGVYEVLMLSRKPIAKQFKKQVKEILHEVRTKGGYIHAAPEDTPEVIMAKALKVADATMKRQQEQLAAARATIAKKDEQLELAAPKVAFVETFATSTTGNILVRDFAGMVAKSLGVKGFGQTAMFEWLKDNGYMNLNRYPSQRSKDMKLLDSTEGFHVHHDGTTGVHHCTRITPKGQTYFFGKLKAQYEAMGRWW